MNGERTAECCFRFVAPLLLRIDSGASRGAECVRFCPGNVTRTQVQLLLNRLPIHGWYRVARVERNAASHDAAVR